MNLKTLHNFKHLNLIDMEKQKFYIIDTTSNAPSIAYVMDESGEIIHTIENCMSFETKKEAQDLINEKGWQDWAGVMAD